ncbi:MAG: type I asparaginase [Muribaculaceae bacterium]|nr:type I asparaginase [Muribaculaceae bacterium]
MSEKPRPRILMIYTGGTIGMKENPVTKALEPFDFNHLLDNVPKLKMLDYDISHHQFHTPIDSSDMNPRHWGQIVKVIDDNYDNFDGFVVLHGTDTMAYTASALSFMLQNLSKPVIITGSQLPIGEVRTDGEENLITALQIAAARDTDGRPTVREVAILFENYLWRGNRSTKRSADNFDAFRSNNYPELAKIGLGISFNKEALWRSKSSSPQLEVHYDMDTNLLCLDLFPGMRECMVRHILNTPGLKAVVLKTFGAGNAPAEPWFSEAIRDAVNKGIIVVNITQCPNGEVDPYRYMTGLELAQTGVVPGHDLTFEAAITKLMYLLGKGLNTDEVKRLMQYNLCGEMS